MDLPDWGALREIAERLEPTRRKAVAEAWARAAQTEHASIASFSRFSLDLLAVGAPPQFLELAHRAALDEISHARLSFAVASAYAGTPLGPGPLPLQRALFEGRNVEAIVRDAAIEGCIVETLASREAQVARDRAGPAAVRQVLEQIAQQEQQHAELAWQFVAWALGAHPPLRARIVERMREELTRLRSMSAPEAEADLSAHGVLSPRQRWETQRAAAGELLEPAVEALQRG